jgi:hypothetical protein
MAAALILYGLHFFGKAWTESIGRAALAVLLKADFEAGREPVRSWLSNPFLKPDFDDLVRQGFAVETTDPAGFALTWKALHPLAPHIAKGGAA